MKNIKFKKLEKLALKIRIETLIAFQSLGFGHIGGSMSIVDLLAVLYGSIIKTTSDIKKKDWLVLSKGHSGTSLYATLAIKGFFDQKELLTLNKPNTILPSHVDKNKTPGIDMTTGSLGQGVSVAVGIALGNKINKINDSNIFLITGDGELNEGQVWEGAMFAAHNKLKKLIWFIDNNKKQLDGYIDDICSPISICKKFESFGFNTQIVNGHDVEEIYNSIHKCFSYKNENPSCIILNTKKGKGCSFVENVLNNHNSVFSDEEISNEIKRIQQIYNSSL